MKGMQESQLCDVWSFRLLPAFAMRAYLSHHRQIAETMSQNKPSVFLGCLARGGGLLSQQQKADLYSINVFNCHHSLNGAHGAPDGVRALLWPRLQQRSYTVLESFLVLEPPII